MNTVDIFTEAAKKLEDIQSKYEIFFRVNNSSISDYIELNVDPYATLKLKENRKLPFPLVNDLKKDFYFVEK